MKRIAVLTSGGDAPGMNACIRAVVRASAARKIDVYGIRNGYTGLIDGDMQRLGARDVSNVIQRGGTILGTSRCDQFLEKAGRARAVGCLQEMEIEGLVAIGGDGTFHGLDQLVTELLLGTR